MTSPLESCIWVWAWSSLGGCGIAPRGSLRSQASAPGRSKELPCAHGPHSSRRKALKWNK